MGSLTHTVGGTDNLVSFKSAARVPIESLKCHFAPIQDGEGDPSPENVRPIRGWDGAEIYQDSVYLPKEYQRIEYIENTELAYIETNYVPVNYDEISMKYTISKKGAYQCLFSAGTGIYQLIALSYGLTTGYESYYCKYFASGGAKNLATYDLTDNTTWCTMTVSSIGRFQSSTRPYDSAISPYENDIDSDNKHLFIFRRADKSSSFVGKMANYTIKNNGVLKLNLIPCIRKIDNKVGAYDTVSDTFYSSISTQEFTAGPEIINAISITFPNINKNLFELTSYSTTDWSTAGYPLSPIIDVEANSVTLTGQGSGDTQLYNLKNVYYPGTYTFSFDMTYVSTVNPDKRMIIRCYNENDQLMKADEVTINNFIYNQYYRGWFGVPQTFTVPNNVKYFRLSIGCGNDKKGDTITISNIQLEYGSTATTYEPYDFYNIVYGGYIDLAKGELVAESILRHFDGTEDWEPTTGADGYAPRRIYLRNVEPSDGKYTGALSDKLASSGNWAPPLYAANINTSGHLVIGVSEDIKTKQDAENWIQSIGGFNVVCKLTNSIHYPIKQSKLTTLLGKNNTWSNTNNITEVSYAVHDSVMIRAAKKRINEATQPRLTFWLCGDDAPVNGKWIERVKKLPFTLYNGADWDSENKYYLFDTLSKGAALDGGPNNAGFTLGHHWRFDFDIWVNRYLARDSMVFFDIGSVTEANKALGFGAGPKGTSGSVSLLNWKLNGNDSSPFKGITYTHPSYPLPSTNEYTHVIGSYKMVDGGDGYDRLIATVNGVTFKFNDIQIPKANYGPNWNIDFLTVGTTIYNRNKLVSNQQYSSYSPCCYIKDIKIFTLN